VFSRRQWSSVAACWEADASRRDGCGGQLLATGTGLAVRTAAVPAHADLVAASARSADGCGRGPRSRPRNV
jgi:hypothetical protein